ncbi:conserved Plasmodium protein, unknown function [Plasmodium berghei]|uniref:Uncharacterized protein n=2 Tax=Plasmodium berghei TaxID=5821 RepID=A0A509AIY6_PLABA|nr:conserved protein, unknown function [Plasmodium berghei ANKA]CXI44893.1 conserved Plasmodium protein, unknown function [Plasmodium berghei]SCM22578.1 conserved Plasmodium protein, unknown function [Plasmodium berghei]SCN25530.1 conserved Plasmodium protein, unknown function [Plasmodium berghei]SCO62264.1 conserved Plasmodium protein, unknown function [Plasmodium berghei]VUC55868.1 conserved protein, unknown function [Plasmodium berghei ANKA]|eukprot:XP_034421678.1 conserved protein, unknown function [Plasmodium berghei ANKA]
MHEKNDNESESSQRSESCKNSSYGIINEELQKPKVKDDNIFNLENKKSNINYDNDLNNSEEKIEKNITLSDSSIASSSKSSIPESEENESFSVYSQDSSNSNKENTPNENDKTEYEYMKKNISKETFESNEDKSHVSKLSVEKSDSSNISKIKSSSSKVSELDKSIESKCVPPFRLEDVKSIPSELSINESNVRNSNLTEMLKDEENWVKKENCIMHETEAMDKNSEYNLSDSFNASFKSENTEKLFKFLNNINESTQSDNGSSSNYSINSSMSNISNINKEGSLVNLFIEKIKLNNILNNFNKYKNAFCVSYFVYEDPMEIFSLYQGINWLPELKNRCTSLSQIEYISSKNIKKNHSSAYANFCQSINLINRKNEYLNMEDDNICYVFISLVGANLDNFEKLHYNNISTKNIPLKGDKQNVLYADEVNPPQTIMKNEKNGYITSKFDNFKRGTNLVKNIEFGIDNNLNKLDETKEKWAQNDIPEFNSEIMNEYKNEIRKVDLMENSKIIIENKYEDYLQILCSTIIPINLLDNKFINKKNKMYDNYNMYPHYVIRIILNNYLDSFKKNEKVNLFHLINKYKNEFTPIGRIKLIANIRNEYYIPDYCDLFDTANLNNMRDRNGHKLINKILKYVRIYKINEDNQENENSIYQNINNLYCTLEADIKKEKQFFNQSISYIKENIYKFYDYKKYTMMEKKLIQCILSMLEASRKKGKYNKCNNRDGKNRKHFRLNEIICSHIIIYVHSLSNITIKLNMLKDFISGNNFYLLIFWNEERMEEKNVDKLKLRNSRILKLNSEDQIGVNSVYLDHEYKCFDRQTTRDYSDIYRNSNIVNINLAFNGYIILPYNHNLKYPEINIILFHNDIPILDLPENIKLNNLFLNNGNQINRSLKIYTPYNEQIKKYLSMDNFCPQINLSFYTHPNNTNLCSSSKYKSLYKNTMNCDINDNIYASYSAPKFNKNGQIYLFFDDNIDNYVANYIFKNDSILKTGKDSFFIPITHENEKGTILCPPNKNSIEKKKQIVQFSKQKTKEDSDKINNKDYLNIVKRSDIHNFYEHNGDIHMYDQDNYNKYVRSIKINIIDFVIAEGEGLQGGEINEWLSFYVYTKNHKKNNVYSGENLKIRLQVEPVGHLRSEYEIDKYKNNEFDKYTDNQSNSENKNCYKCKNKLAGVDHFCYKPFNEINETIEYNVEDLKNGIYKILYKISKTGTKKLHIYCDGINIIGSPYDIKIFHSKSHSKFTKILGTGATRCLATPLLNLETHFMNNDNLEYNELNEHDLNLCHKKSAKVDHNILQLKLFDQKISEMEANNSKSTKNRLASPNLKETNANDEKEKEKHKRTIVNDEENKEKKKEKMNDQNESKSNDIKTEQTNDEKFYEITVINKDAFPKPDINKKNEEKDETKLSYFSEYDNMVKNNENIMMNNNIININTANKEKYKNLMKKMEIVNSFTIILSDMYGQRIRIGNDNVKVVGKKGAHIKNVIDNNDGSYKIEYVSYFKGENEETYMSTNNNVKTTEDINGSFSFENKYRKIQNINPENIIEFYNEYLFQEKKYYDNIIIKEFENQFNNIPIYCQIHIYVNEVEIFGSPIKPIFMNIHNIIHFYNLYDQYTYSGLLLKNFEYLLRTNNYKKCINMLSKFYGNFLDEYELGSNNRNCDVHMNNFFPLKYQENHNTMFSYENIGNESFFFKIPLNILDFKKKGLINDGVLTGKPVWNWEANKCKEELCDNIEKFQKVDNNIYTMKNGNLWGDKYNDNISTETESYFINEWLYMYLRKMELDKVDKKQNFSLNLAYSLSNIILHHLVYMKKYKYFINCKLYEHDLIQNNILDQFKKLLEEEYNKMFAYQTSNIINYCKQIGNVKFKSLEELIKVYKNISYELKKLNKIDLANDFDKCCENMCEELYLKNIEANLKRKEIMLNKYEDIINEKIGKINKIKTELEKYKEMNNNSTNVEKVLNICNVKVNKAIQTYDYLSYKNGFLNGLIKSREENENNKSDIANYKQAYSKSLEKNISIMVRENWKNSSPYDKFTSIKNVLKSCPRLKTTLEETFNYYSCSNNKKNNKMKDFQIKKIQEIKIIENLDNLKKIELNEDNVLVQNELLNTSYLTYNAYILLIADLNCSKYFIKDVGNVLWLFEKFSVQHNSYKNLNNPYKLMRVIPKYLFIPLIRELAYLNMLYIISEFVIINDEDQNIYLKINHPSRLSSFYHFIKHSFIDFYENLSSQQNFQNFKEDLIEPYDQQDVKNQNEKDDPAPIHINLHEFETYFNNELPLVVKHKNFEKTFPLLFEYYAKFSISRDSKKEPNYSQNDIHSSRNTSTNHNKNNNDNSINTNDQISIQTKDNSENNNKFVSVAMFIRFLREFGIIPHFFSNNVAIKILNSFMKDKKKLDYNDFSHAIILSICECVKKNILAQYNMLKMNKQLGSKIETEKIFNQNYISYETKELVYLFGLSDLRIVKSKINS